MGRPSVVPGWVDEVEDSLGIVPGLPLSPMALVQKPAKIEGVVAWTLEAAQRRGAVIQAAFGPDGLPGISYWDDDNDELRFARMNAFTNTP